MVLQLSKVMTRCSAVARKPCGDLDWAVQSAGIDARLRCLLDDSADHDGKVRGAGA